MQRSGGRNTAAIFLLFLTLVVGRLGAAPITYVLLPGSTITPTVGPSPTGPTEDLTGSFTVQLASDYNFQYTALNFHSASTRWTLDPQDVWSLTLDANSSTAYFQVELDDTGLAPSPLQAVSWSAWQPFQGPPNSPTRFDFPNMGVGPAAGGNWEGSMTLIAVQALPGDANLDGRVDVNDLTIVLTNFGQTGMTWSQGEFTGDGTVDVNDLTIVLANFGQSLAASVGAAVAVPEPAALVLLGIGMAGLFGYAWQRRTTG